MTLNEIVSSISTGGWIGIAILVMTLIQISPIKIDPWNAIARWLGSVINKELMSKMNTLQLKVDRMEQGIKEISNTLDNHISKDDDDKMDSNRSKILDFAGEIANGKTHTMEQYKWIINKITEYRKYCDEHPGFLNSQCEESMAAILNKYRGHIENGDFADGKK